MVVVCGVYRGPCPPLPVYERWVGGGVWWVQGALSSPARLREVGGVLVCSVYDPDDGVQKFPL